MINIAFGNFNWYNLSILTNRKNTMKHTEKFQKYKQNREKREYKKEINNIDRKRII